MASTTEPTRSEPGPAASPPAFRAGLLLRGLALGVLVVLVALCLRTFVGSNFHTVIPGRVYRSAQPTADSLASMQRRHGIRTIVNLRGGDENDAEPWHQEEKQAAKALGIRMLPAGLSSKEQAPTEDFRIFIQAIKDAEEPVLIHCANGNDRSGLASAIYLLMRTDTPMATARKQLSMRYGYLGSLPWSKAACLDRVLDSYEAWLAKNNWEHTPERLYHWGMLVYEPEWLK
jgi:protein tyrosine phosphatase (PTP) superfamily phosphohydrolase (DUF442 family)